MKTDGWVVQESILNLIPHKIRAHFPPSPLCVVRNLNVLDMYGCEARVARWAQLFQLNAVAFDPLYSPEKMCLETSHGTALALLLMFRIIPGGLVTFISPGFSTWAPETANALYGRSLKNVYGDMSTFGVQEGNLLNSNVALLCKVAEALNVTWVITQPPRSLFWRTCEMAEVCNVDVSTVLSPPLPCYELYSNDRIMVKRMMHTDTSHVTKTPCEPDTVEVCLEVLRNNFKGLHPSLD